MIFGKKIGISIPAFNEEGFISATIKNVPAYVDVIACVNDASTDNTLQEMKSVAKKDKRIVVINNEINGGVGFSVKRGFDQLIISECDYVVIAPGDNQCDLSRIKEFISVCEETASDVCRGNRFLDRKSLLSMPFHRRFGNSIYSFITKFVSGYYSLFDFQSSFSTIRTSVLKQIPNNALRNDYLFDNSLWINLNIVNAKVKEVPIPSIYGDEVSDINYFRFVTSSFGYLISAFIRRIYEKYILLFSPVGLFLIAGSTLFIFGILFGLFVALDSIGTKTASTATVMLSVVPFIVGFQLLLQAIVLDIQNEPS